MANIINRKISVIGLGYVGLPLAVAFGLKDQVIGFDIDGKRIAELKNAIDRTKEVTNKELEKTNILFTSNIDDVVRADFHIVAVPTPVDDAHVPDLTPLEMVSQTLGKVLKTGDVVVYESTVYPGVTEEICIPILENVSGLKCGVDFSVGYSPERINPGDKERTFTNILKIVSGQDNVTLDIIADVYSSVVVAGVHKASSIKVAEAAKVIENTQRDLNIALMNELAIIFERMNIDTTEVLEAAGTKWNFLPFKPGLVGGHCIGVDPYYLTHKAEKLGYIPQVIHAGRRINDNMGRFIARKGIKLLMQQGHNMQNLNVAVLGFTFKENCPDVRNTRAVDLVREFEDYGAKVFVVDPVADSIAVKDEYGIQLTDFNNLEKVSILVVAVGHDTFKNIKLNEITSKVEMGGVILDVKAILPKDDLISNGYRLWRL